MKRILYGMKIVLLSTLFCAISFSLCFGADKSIIDRQIRKASEFKDSGNFEAAVNELTILLKSDELKNDSYTKGYIETLIQCLQADLITYLATVRHATKLAQDNKKTFLQIADELKTAELSRRSLESITRMRQEMSRALVTHDFCVAPLGYEKLHETMLEGVYHYAKAWGKLEEFGASQKKLEEGELEAEALMHFQKANKLFELAAMILERINR